MRPGRAPDPLRRQCGIVSRHLQVMDADVIERAEPALADEVLGEADGGHEAVVEGAHGPALGRGGGVAHPPGVFHADGHGLLADHVLARLQGGDAGLRMDGIGPAVVEDVDPRVGGHLVPVAAIFFVAVAGGLAGGQVGLLIAEHQQAGGDLGRRVDVGDLLVGVGMALAHEAAAQQADAQFLGCAGGGFGDGHEMAPIFQSGVVLPKSAAVHSPAVRSLRSCTIRLRRCRSARRSAGTTGAMETLSIVQDLYLGNASKNR